MSTLKYDFSHGVREAINEAIALKEDKTIRVYQKESDEYKKLQAACELLNTFGREKCYIKETYFDYGQDWKWTTIIADSSLGGYQKLNPKDQEDIIFARNAKELAAVVDRIVKK